MIETGSLFHFVTIPSQHQSHSIRNKYYQCMLQLYCSQLADDNNYHLEFGTHRATAIWLYQSVTDGRTDKG